MLTDLEIANLALGHLGCQRISSLADDNNRAKILSDFLQVSRDYTLEMTPWDFAIKRVALTANGNTPAFEWTQEFDEPTDLIKIVSEYEDNPYYRENGKILSDASTLKLKYIYRIDEDVQRTATFDMAWSLILASMVCYSLTQNASLKAQLLQDAQDKVSTSMSLNAIGSSPMDYSFDVFTNERL